MLRKLRTRIKGQSTAEYAILIALVVAAIIAMQTYAKRALQAKVRDAVIYMKNQTSDLGNSIQYEPYYLESNYAVTRTSDGGQRFDANTTGYLTTQGVNRDSGGLQKLGFNTQLINRSDL